MSDESIRLVNSLQRSIFRVAPPRLAMVWVTGIGLATGTATATEMDLGMLSERRQA